MVVVAEKSAERELRDAVRRHRRAIAAAAELEARRDEAIRAALSAGLTYPQVAEIAGLNRSRIGQIRRGDRV